jgi:hypothetical protein
VSDIKTYYRIVKSVAQLLSLSGLYNFEHPIVKEKIGQTFLGIADFINSTGKSVIFARSADIFFLNGEKINPEERLMKKFIEAFVSLEIGSWEFAHGLTREELAVFMQVLSAKERIQGADKVKAFLNAKGSAHMVVRDATFKLVQEDEAVVKKGGILKMDELPQELVKRFSQDLVAGKVASQLKVRDKDYKMAAHDANLVAGLAFDMVEKEGSPQSLEKVLWAVADYLIGEISTTKEEDVNRKVLDEMKAYFITHLKTKNAAPEWEKEAHRTFAVIDTALQLKGLTALYRKHKKGMAIAYKKISSILDNLPADSELYKKTKSQLGEEAKYET